MLAAIRRQLNKTNNVNRSAYLWNAINAGLSSALCPVILMVVTRTNGLDDAGVFSIAFAVATLALYLGQYGLRRFQSSDINEKYSFREYHGMRFITCAAMIVACLGYCVYGMVFRDYTPEKFTVIYLICLLKVIQAYADVIHGHMQQKGRLDVAAKASAVRFFSEIMSLGIALILTRDLILSSAICLMVSLCVLIITTMNAAREYCDTFRPSITPYKFKWLLIEGFPIFVSMFLNIYISNAPKYAIDGILTDKVQAYFNYIFMPALVIQLVAYFIFNPIITSYAKLWLSEREEDLRTMKKMVGKMCALLAALTVLAVVVAYTIGIPVLSLMFGVDLGDYRKELCILMIGGGMMAYGMYFSTVITIIRKQVFLLVSYGVASIVAKFMSDHMVRHYEIMGATVTYTVVMAMLAVMLGVITLWGVGKGSGADR